MEKGPDVITDVLNHAQALTLSLQGKDKMVSDIVQTIFSLHNKINLFQRDIKTNFLQHFHLHKGLVNSENDLCSEKIKVYVESLQGASINFIAWSTDLENRKHTFAFLVNPFVADVAKD